MIGESSSIPGKERTDGVPGFRLHRSERRNGIARVALRGELDLAAVPAFEEHLAYLDHDGVRAIIVDLRDLAFIDSTGLRALLGAWKDAQTNGHDLAIVGASDGAKRVFALTGTERILDDHGGLDLLQRFVRGRGTGSEASGDGQRRE